MASVLSQTEKRIRSKFGPHKNRAERRLDARKYVLKIEPQPGPQTQFMTTPVDICIYGGSAGGGKSFALMLESIRNTGNSLFKAVFFRRTYPQINNPGGLWDESMGLYPYVGAKPNKSEHSWIFPSGASVKFAHMQREDNKYDWQGSQIAAIYFDELTHFSAEQFWYMLSRNRSVSGVRPYVRATCNPDADSWVAELISWWIGEDGYAIPERSGKVRYFIRKDGELIWANTAEELKEKYGEEWEPKSFTFILSTVYNNKKLLEKDPSYISNLKSLPTVERERLLGDMERGGNWKIKLESGAVFNRAWFNIIRTEVPELPEVLSVEERNELLSQYFSPVNGPLSGFPPKLDINSLIPSGEEVRFWDFAATEQKLKKDNPDYTVGLKLRKAAGRFYILDVIAVRLNAAETDKLLLATARQDGFRCKVRWEVEGGASGKRDSSRLREMLRKEGFDAEGIRPTGDKVMRARPVAHAAEKGLVYLVEAPWNHAFLSELHAFPSKDWHDDKVDGLSGAYNAIMGGFRKARQYSGGLTASEAFNLYGSKQKAVKSQELLETVEALLEQAIPAKTEVTIREETESPIEARKRLRTMELTRLRKAQEAIASKTAHDLNRSMAVDAVGAGKEALPLSSTP